VGEVLPGYRGPRSGQTDVPRSLASALPVTQVDGRSNAVDQIFSGQRFLVKVDALKAGLRRFVPEPVLDPPRAHL